MPEIGGYFGLEQLISNEYHKELIPLNNGRNALLYLLKAKNIKKVFIPHYLCESIVHVCRTNGFQYEFYNTDSEFMPVFDKELAQDEYIYIVNYFGQITDEMILDLKMRYNRIIIDNTHAFFQKPVEGIDTLYSCRKFFGVPDGGYLSTDVQMKENLEVDVSMDRMTHILGRYEGSASDYYSCFQSNDQSFMTEPLKSMSRLTHNILGAIDYEMIRRIRHDNYEYLMCEFLKRNKLKLKTPDGAFAYPLYAENGIEIRKALAQKRIYIPTLWPNVLTDTPEDCIEHDYAANILPLPCDQRYGIDDMKYMVGELKKCIS